MIYKPFHEIVKKIKFQENSIIISLKYLKDY